MAKIQTINLRESERAQLEAMLKRGRWSRNEINRANILILADKEKDTTNKAIAGRLHCDRDTVREIKKRYVEEGLEAALSDRSRSGQPKKLEPKEEALIVATACSEVPAGYDHWTIELLRTFINKKRPGKPISKQPIVRVMLQNELKPWLKKNVGYPQCNT